MQFVENNNKLTLLDKLITILGRSKMYLEHTKSKLGSTTNAKMHTGGSESVTRLKRKTGGAVYRSKHADGGLAKVEDKMSKADGGVLDKHKRGSAVKRKRHGMGGMATMGGGCGVMPAGMQQPYSANGMNQMQGLARKKGGSVRRSRHAEGGMAPSLATKFASTTRPASVARKTGGGVKREHHFLGALTGLMSAASAIPSIISMIKKKD